MKSRVHSPSQKITLGELCRLAHIPCPLDDEAQNALKVELGAKEQGELDIVQNFPERSFSVRTTDPEKALHLLAYEAHCWQAWEVMRYLRSRTQGASTLLT